MTTKISFRTGSRSSLFFGLLILAICALFNATSRGVLDFFAVFMLPLTTEFGWSRTGVSGVYSVAFVVYGLSGPLVGWCFDRFGPVFNYLAGTVIISIGLALSAYVEELWQLYACYALIVGCGVTFFANVTSASLLRRWFTKRLNTAIATSYASSSIGMLTFAPAAQYVIAQSGWRSAFLAAAVILQIGIILAFLLWLIKASRGRPIAIQPEKPREERPLDKPSSVPAQTLRDGLTDHAFWGLAWVFVTTGIGMYTLLLQVPALLVEQGYEPQFAANAYGLIGLLAPVGMVSFALLGDHYRRRNIVLLSFAMTALGVASMFMLLQQQSLLWLGLFIFFFGGSFGARGPAISAIAAGLFGGPKFASIYGYLTIFMGGGAAAGSWLGGLCRDLTGDYTTGTVVSFIAVSIGTFPFLFVARIAKAE